MARKFVDDAFCSRVLAWVRRERHQRAFAGFARDLPVFLGDECVARDQLGLHALIAHLAHDKTSFGVVTANVGDVDAGLLHLRDESRVVFLTSGVGFVHGILETGLVHVFAGLVGEAFAVRGLVMQDRDLLAGIFACHVGACNLALLVIATAHAEHVRAGAFVGQFRVGGCRRNLNDAFFGVDVRRRDR